MALLLAFAAACGRAPPPPELLAVAPGRAANDVATALDIFGRHFEPRLRGDLAEPSAGELDLGFELTLKGAAGVVALAEVQLRSRGELGALVPAGLPPATYDLALVDPRGRRAQLASALTIFDPQQQQVTCAPDDPCTDEDPCTTSEACVAGFCDAGPADKDADGDGHVDEACGGDDCDDDPGSCGADCSPSYVGLDLCDGLDRDCDGFDCLDADGDGVIDPLDVCPGFDDRLDADGDEIPDGCDDCLDPGYATAWWDPAYTARLPLTVTETAAGDLPGDYSLRLTLDTAAWIAAGELLPGGDDLRVVRHDGALASELDRRVIGIDSASTEVWFKTRAPVSDSDASYYLYIGNAAAGAPPARWADQMGAGDPSQVYLAADDFETGAPGTTPAGWEGSARYLLEQEGDNQLLAVDGADGPADYLFAGDSTWTDVVVTARFAVPVTSGTYCGLWLRAGDNTNFETLFFGLADNDTFVVYGPCTIASATATSISGGSALRTWNLGTPAGGGWHVLEARLAGRQTAYLYDGAQLGTHTLAVGQLTSGRIGLCAGYPVTRVLWDDVVVRRYVSPEPTVTAGTREPRCL